MTAEQFLARLYVDDALRRRFLTRPFETVKEAGFDDETARKLAAIDSDDLVLAARSYAKKREEKALHARHSGKLRRITKFFRR